MNLEKFNKTANEINGNYSGNDWELKLENDTKTNVRIVPYKFDKDMPFITVWMHYNVKDLDGRAFTSPKTIGKPDPIIETVQKLYATKSEEDKELAKKINATRQFYCPVIIRGKEEEGVKFWRFSKTIFDEIVDIVNNEDYGDITDPAAGYDLIITKTSPVGTTKFAKISVAARTKPTPIHTDASIVESILENQRDLINDILKVKYSYDEIVEIFAKFKESLTEEETQDEGIADDVDEIMKQINS